MRPWSSFNLAEHGVEKIVARRAAMELRDGMAANLGFGICSMVPRILLEEGQPQAVTWAIEQGAVGGMPLMGFAFGCASNADAFMPSPQQFTYFQGGGFDVTFLSFLEIDLEGNVNVSKLGKKPYLTAGCGGFVDITARARKIVFAGQFEAGAQFELTDGAIRRREARQVPEDGREGRARHLLRPAGARARAGGALRHRALRDPADRRGPRRDRGDAGHRPAARHRRRVARPGTPGGRREDPAGKPARAGPMGLKLAPKADRSSFPWARAGEGGVVSDLHLTIEGAVATLRLDNPAKLNSLTVPMLEALDAHCATLERSPEVRAVIVTGDRGEGLLHRRGHHRLGADGAVRLRPRTGCARGTGSSTGWRAWASRPSRR